MSTRLQTFAIGLDLITEECCNCGTPFAFPKELYRELQEKGGSFFCPRGHVQHYAENEVTKLRAEVERKRIALDSAHLEQNKLRDERDHHWTERKKLNTRHAHLKERIKNGVCPCCHRHFRELQKHMETEHPTFNASEK